MAQQGISVWTLAQKLATFDKLDRLVLMYGASTANQNGSVAQTASISIDHLFANSQIDFLGNTSTTNSVSTVTFTSNGAVLLINLPTTNPHTNNQLWSNSGVATVSSG